MAEEILMIGIICDQFISRHLSSGLAELFQWKSFGLQSQGEIKKGDFFIGYANNFFLWISSPESLS